VDTLSVPLLTRMLGRRRGWMLLAQGSIIAAITGMALVDPSQGHLTMMALAAVLLGFSSATQDIVIDAYRIESADVSLQALLSSTYIAGYRIGMLLSGAGTLFLASAFGSAQGAYDHQAWQWAYLIMAAAMAVGVLTTLMIDEPATHETRTPALSNREHAGILFMFVASITGFIMVFYHSAALADALSHTLNRALPTEAVARFLAEAVRFGMGMVAVWLIATLMIDAGVVSRDTMQDTYITPLLDFFRRYGVKSALVLLLLIGVYRISDIVLGVIANVFYQDMGFTKPEIAGVVKTFGLFMTIAGGFLGGLLSVRYGVLRILSLGALLSATTNLLFIALAAVGHDLNLLYLVISVDNLSAGLASAAFVAFLSSLTNIQFTAMQYAIFSSLMTLFPKVLGGYSGAIVDSLGYSRFFMLTALLGLPVLVLIRYTRHSLDPSTTTNRL